MEAPPRRRRRRVRDGRGGDCPHRGRRGVLLSRFARPLLCRDTRLRCRVRLPSRDAAVGARPYDWHRDALRSSPTAGDVTHADPATRPGGGATTLGGPRTEQRSDVLTLSARVGADQDARRGPALCLRACRKARGRAAGARPCQWAWDALAPTATTSMLSSLGTRPVLGRQVAGVHRRAARPNRGRGRRARRPDGAVPGRLTRARTTGNGCSSDSPRGRVVQPGRTT